MTRQDYVYGPKGPPVIPGLTESVRAALARQSQGLARDSGDYIVSAAGQAGLVARVETENSPQSWVVTLGPVTQPNQFGPLGNTITGINPQVVLDSLAIVEFGHGSAAQWALLDWNKGQQFSVFGSFVRVFAFINAYGTAGAPPIPETRFSGSIIPGECRNTPVRTVQYPTIAAATSFTLPVPPFARRLFAFVDATNYATLAIVGRTTTGTIIWRTLWGINGVPTANASWRGDMIPVGTNFLTIDNNGGAGVVPRIVYELGLS